MRLRSGLLFAVVLASIHGVLLACGGAGDGLLFAGDDAGGGSAPRDATTPSDGAAPDASGTTGDGEGSPRTDSSTEDGGATRPFLLAAGGVQLVVAGGPLGFQITPANLAEDVDVIELHEEYFGIPWDEFSRGAAPPAAWASVMQAHADAAHATKKPVFLSVSMLNGGRNSAAPRTTVDSSGAVKSEDGWAANCFDFGSADGGAALGDAYLRYVAWMVDRFTPAYLNVAVEVNLFFEKCPSAARSLVALSNRTYDAVKAQAPATVVFPSIQIDHLYGYATDSCPDGGVKSDCFDANYAEVVPLKRDRFAMSTYPSLGGLTASGRMATPADLPADWFTRGPSRAREVGLLAETGWNSVNLVAQLGLSCQTVLTCTDDDETAYLRVVLAAAQAGELELVNWWSDRDLVTEKLMTDCPCSFDGNWCAVETIFRGGAAPGLGGPSTSQFLGEVVLKAFGAMGLRTYDGAKKAAEYAVWNAARGLPYRR